jgi:DNA polymerase III delta prime subunit
MLNIHCKQREIVSNLLEAGTQVFLLVGQSGIGKRTLVRSIAKSMSFEVMEFDSLNMQEARELKSSAIRFSDTKKLILMNGSNISFQVYNAILKLLEEPYLGNTFVLSSNTHPPATIVSRCNVVHFPPLTDDELFEVLKFKGMNERTIRAVLPHADGSVEKAMTVYISMDEKKKMLPYLGAIKEHTAQFVFKSKIDDVQIGLLRELVDDFILAKYGIKNLELLSLGNFSVEFLENVRGCLVNNRNPYLSYVGAYYNA